MIYKIFLQIEPAYPGFKIYSVIDHINLLVILCVTTVKPPQ